MTSALVERIGNRRVVASISGGKDSAAMSLWLTDQGVEHERVHLLTGWDSTVTMDYIHGPLTRAIGPIIEVRGERLMEELIEHKGMFPSKARRFCTEELKVFPMQRYINSRVETGEDIINAVGIRAGESAARAKMSEWEWSDGFDCEVWRPLIDWSEQDVINIHKRHGVAPNPLYLKGLTRVGCWPCIYARKDEIRTLAKVDPDRIVHIRSIEERTHHAARERWEGRLATWKALTIDEKINRRALSQQKDRAPHAGDAPKPYHRPTFFQAATGYAVRLCHECSKGRHLACNGKGCDGCGGGQCEACNGRGTLRRPSGDTWPIDRVVTWSRTLHGGKVEDRQLPLELFASHNAGCMRWGLCDTGSDA